MDVRALATALADGNYSVSKESFVTQRILRSLFVVLLCTQASMALAQGFRDAEVEYNRGELLLEMRDYPRAVFAFNKAYAILPDQRYLSGLARAYFRKGEQERALVLGEQYLAIAGDKADERILKLVDILRGEFAKGRGRVELTLFPQGGKLTVVLADGSQETVTVDSKTVTRYLPVGTLNVVYEKDGFELGQKQVLVDRSVPQQVRLELAQATGESELVVDANVRNATVFVDGKKAGTTPFKQRLAAGDHIVQVWSENHLAWTGVVDAPAARAVSLQADLVPATGKVSGVPIPQIRVEKHSNFWRLSTWGWMTMGTGIAAGGAAGYFYYAFNQKWAEVNAAEGDDDLQNKLFTEATTLYNMTMIAGIAGGALIGGGLLMVLLDKGDKLEDSATFELLSLSPAVTPDAVLLDAAFSF